MIGDVRRDGISSLWQYVFNQWVDFSSIANLLIPVIFSAATDVS